MLSKGEWILYKWNSYDREGYITAVSGDWYQTSWPKSTTMDGKVLGYTLYWIHKDSVK